MSENILSNYKKELLRNKAGYGKSLESEAKRICKNEALKLINECLANPEFVSVEKVKQIRDRVNGLRENLRVDISPFKPSKESGFYVRKTQVRGRTICVDLRGLTSKTPVLSLVQYILMTTYDAKMKQDPENQYKGLIMQGEEEVGDAFYVKGGGLRIRLEKYKQRMFIKSWNEGFSIKCSISCPFEVKEKVLPKLQELEEVYWEPTLK